MRQIIGNARVLTPDGLRDGLAVVIANGRIESIERQEAALDGERIDLGGGVLAPGFVDVQVNGGAGVLFNDAPSVETIAAIGAAHRRYGTTGFLPTLISDDLDAVARAIAAADAAIEAGVPGVLGVHIEGPFLNPVRSGVHDKAKIRKLDDDAITLLASAKHGRTLVTLAPETTTPEAIARLVQAGVIVSAGHTNATYAETIAAIDAGVSGFTHLFNAMSPLTSREPGVVGAALDDERAYVGIICDGRHIAPASLRIAFRAKPHARIMLVTDAMPSVGMADKRFKLQGRDIRVEDGVCVDENGTLAGADLDMATSLRNALAFTGVELAAGLRMASANPAAFLRLDSEIGAIAPGMRANLVHLDDELCVRGVWIDGVRQAD